MKQRFKRGDWICYIDRLFQKEVLAKNGVPVIGSGYIKDFVTGGYELRNGDFVAEPFVYASHDEAKHEHVTALLLYLKDVSEARELLIEKLEEYGIEGFDLTDRGDLDDLVYINKQLEHIRSIPKDRRTPAMKALVWAVEHPSVEDP